MLGITLALAFAGGTAAQCAAPPSLLSAPPAHVSYASTFDATVWGGERIANNGGISLTYSDPLKVALTDAKTKKRAVVRDAMLGACGAIESASQAQSFVAYNAALALASNASSAPKPGDTWNSTVRLYASATQEIDVPVRVSVVKADRDSYTLQASGSASSTLTQYGTPINLAYQAAARFEGGWLVQARSAAQENVQAGPESQTMKFAWQLTRQKG